MTSHRFNPNNAEKLLDPKRKILVDPEQIINLLDLNKNDIVADLGAGNGCFTIPFSKKTWETVYAVDIEPIMLNLLKERVSQEKITNIQFIESNLENIMLGDNCVDKAIVAFVMHEIPSMEKALIEFNRIIKAGGRLVILEWEGIVSEVGPPINERISSRSLKKFIVDNGFKTTVYSLNKDVYAIKINIE